MSPTSSSKALLAACPHCGASIPEANASHCACCGTELAPATAAEQAPRPPAARLAPELGLGAAPRRSAPLAPAPGRDPLAPSGGPLAPGRDPLALRGEPLASRVERTAPRTAAPMATRLAAVRRQREFAAWSAEQPLGLAHVLGLGAMALFGLFLGLMPLVGLVQTRQPRDTGLVMGLFALIGLGLAAFAIVQLGLFYRAPILHRPAVVVDERSELRRTKSGYRTSYYATFEFEDGERDEFPVGSSLAATITRGDVGLAISRHRVLLAFHRAQAV